MAILDWVQNALYCALILLLTRPLGGYMAAAFQGERTFLSPVLRPIERGFYALSGIDPASEQHWTRYAVAMLLFNGFGFALLYAILRLQDFLPYNPQGLPGVPADLAFNTAMSFTTNTNWQSYGGEATLSYFSQMAGLTVQNFVSAATGMALAIALVRGFARAQAKTVGNFWADLTRATLYILLPLAIVLALLLAWQGVPQNLEAYVPAETLEGGTQVLAQGPVASQVAIKQLGSNGGGFFNVNSAHPYENPTPLSNLFQMLALIAIAAALTNTFGRMVRDERQGWAVFAAMSVMFLAGLFLVYTQEAGGNPIVAALGAEGGNMEGKELRFGVVNSAIWATATTAASNGSVNAMHDSFLPLAGLVPLFNMELGEVVFGGVGAGLYGMLLFAILAIFIAGLMVGRSPEYLGKKIESREVKLAILAIAVLPLFILCFSAWAAVSPMGLAGLQDKGPHGFSEILYAYTSAVGNNGSAFAGLTANSLFYNTTLGIAMFIGRFAMIIPMLAIAGSLAAKKSVPASAGSFPTHGAMWVVLLTATVLIVGGLTFLPALALGPIAEHFAMLAGQTF